MLDEWKSQDKYYERLIEENKKRTDNKNEFIKKQQSKAHKML